MKRFQFKLEAVLHERKRLEDLKLKDWNLARNLLKQIEDEKTSLEKRLEEVVRQSSEMNALQAGSSASFQSMDSFIGGQKLRIEWKSQQLQKGRKIVERARLEYVAASVKRKALEKLKERREKEYKLKLHKQELKTLDDLYTMRWHLGQDEEK